MSEFVTTYGVGEFEHIADESGEIWTEYGVTSQPSFVYINDDGESEVTSGGRDLIERVEGLIAS